MFMFVCKTAVTPKEVLMDVKIDTIANDSKKRGDLCSWFSNRVAATADSEDNNADL